MESELIQSGVPSSPAESLCVCVCVFIFRLCETEMKGGSWGGREEARQEVFGGAEQLHCIVRERSCRVVHITCITSRSYQHRLTFTWVEKTAMMSKLYLSQFISWGEDPALRDGRHIWSPWWLAAVQLINSSPSITPGRTWASINKVSSSAPQLYHRLIDLLASGWKKSPPPPRSTSCSQLRCLSITCTDRGAVQADGR